MTGSPRPKDDSGRISRLEGIVESLAKGQETLTHSLRGLSDDVRTGFDKIHERIGRVTEKSVDRSRIQWSPIIAGGSVILALAAMALSGLREDISRGETDHHRQAAFTAAERLHLLEELQAGRERLKADLSVIRQWQTEHERGDVEIHARGFEAGATRDGRLHAIEREVFGKAAGE